MKEGFCEINLSETTFGRYKLPGELGKTVLVYCLVPPVIFTGDTYIIDAGMNLAVW